MATPSILTHICVFVKANKRGYRRAVTSSLIAGNRTLVARSPSRAGQVLASTERVLRGVVAQFGKGTVP